MLKKILLLLPAVVAIAVAGCKDSSADQDALAKIRQAGVIRWGADDSGGGPFVYKDPNNPGRSIGFEVDIMDCVARHIGVRHEIVLNQWDELIPTLQAKRCDIVMNGIEINSERQQRVLFSTPYYLYEQQLTVRAEDKDKYKTLADLKGRKIATLSAAQANEVLKEAGFTGDQIQPRPDSQTPYDELENKRVDAVLQENIIAAFYADPAQKPKLFNVPQTFAPGQYGVAVRKGDETLMNEINRVLKLMMENGELAEIYQRWHIWNDQQRQLGIKPKAAQTAPAEEKATFDVVLKAAGDRKIGVIKVVREATGLGLKDAKDLVDGVPKIVKAALPKQEAEKLKKALEDQGATVELKEQN